MTMRPFTDVRGGLNHLVDAQIGRAFPVVHKVYQHLDAIEYIAQVYESGRSRDIVLRTNHTKEWIEWQYKGEDTWTILFKFSDLLGAGIADVVAAEQAIAAELVALRVHIDQARSDTLDASGRAQAAELGAVDAKNAAEVAQAGAHASAQSAADHQIATEVAATTGAQHLANIEAQVVAAEALKQETVAAHQVGLAAKASAEEAAVNAATFAENADVSASESATSANEAEASANAAELSAQNAAAHKVEAENQAVAAVASALASATSAAVSSEKLGELIPLHAAAVTASTTATEAAETVTTHLAQVTALHSAIESFAQAAQTSAVQADSAATAAGVSASDALQLRNETQGFHDAASTMVVDAAQVSADRSTVQTLVQEVQLAVNQAQSNALAAADSADTAAASASAAAISATDAQANAGVVQGQVTAITGRLDEADSIVTTVTTLRDETLSYKLAVQDSTTNAQAVAADRAAVADMMGTIAADAASVADSKDQALTAAATAAQAEAAANIAITVAQGAAQEVASNTTAAQDAAAAALSSQTLASDSATQAAASLTAVVPLHTEVVAKHAEVLVKADQVAEDLLAADAAKGAAEIAQTDTEAAKALARAWATKTDGPVLNDGGDKFSAQYWAIQAEQSAIVAADANTGVLGALANHTAAVDPHTQYLTKAESTNVLAAKVDKEVGKGLSTEDYTTAEQAKLASVEAGANAYTHPDNHPASIITQDENNRFVSDAEKAAWNAKQDTLVSGTNIKTINGVSLLGGGDLVVTGSGGGGPTLQGDTTPYITQTKTYQITNFNSFSSYTVSASDGTASISGDTITYTAPATASSVDLTLMVDGQPTVFVITVQPAGVAKPTNIDPTDGATDIPDAPTLQSSAFVAYGQADTHLASRWTLYQGGTQVHSSGWRTDALTSYAVPAGVMAESTAYTWTVEHRGTTLGDSPASTATSFTTKASFNSYIATPTPTPANFGDPLEGGFYAGMIWNQLVQSATSMVIATGSKTFTVPDMSSAPIVYGGQMVEVRSRANPANKFVGTVTGALGTSLTINVTSIGGSGTFSDWSVMARHRVIVAPKASGEHAGIALKNDTSALPTACQTLAEGFAATQAMRDADSSTVYPAAHWARNLNIGGRTDWYIPARDELELCWRNLKPVTNNNYVTAGRPTAASFNYANNGSYGDTADTHGLNNNSAPTGAAYTAAVPAQTAAAAFRTGGTEAYEFGSAYYWSSSDYSASFAWFQYWRSSSPGSQDYGSKSILPRVRAVRRSVI